MPDPSRRILLINHEYPPLAGAGGEATFQIAREMARQGHQPIVLTAAFRDVSGLALEDGVTVRRVNSLRQNTDDCSVPEMIAFGVAARFAAPALVRQWRPDAALAFYGLPAGFVAMRLKHLTGLPYAIALQGPDVPGYGRNAFADWHRLAGGLMRRAWRDANIIAANSDSVAAAAGPQAPGRAIEVIPAGTDVGEIAAKADYARHDELRLLFVGRLVQEKGLDVLVQALAKLPLNLPWRLVLAGDGPEWTMLAGLAARLNIADRIQVRGWVQRSELLALYGEADVFVLPSRADGTPTAVLEAMAAGLPVVATHVPGTAEMISDGDTGLLVPTEDAEALSAAITALATDDARRAALGRAARARAEAYFSWRAITTAWLDTLARLAGP
jgi:glycosyltransferase involved in cell wall biosynthesis